MVQLLLWVRLVSNFLEERGLVYISHRGLTFSPCVRPECVEGSSALVCRGALCKFILSVLDDLADQDLKRVGCTATNRLRPPDPIHHDLRGVQSDVFLLAVPYDVHEGCGSISHTILEHLTCLRVGSVVEDVTLVREAGEGCLSVPDLW